MFSAGIPQQKQNSIASFIGQVAPLPLRTTGVTALPDDIVEALFVVEPNKAPAFFSEIFKKYPGWLNNTSFVCLGLSLY